jgi:hypothetical protein
MLENNGKLAIPPDHRSDSFVTETTRHPCLGKVLVPGHVLTRLEGGAALFLAGGLRR